MVGAELPMTSDQVIWSEQNRLHISYNSCTFVDAGANEASTITLGGGATALNVISINDTVVVLDPAGLESKGIVTAVISGTGAAAGTITVQPFGNTSLTTDGFAATGLKVFVYGSGYSKGTSIGAGAGNSAGRVSVEPQYLLNIQTLQLLLEINT